MQVKGLQGELQGVQQNESFEQETNQYNMESDIIDNKDIDYQDDFLINSITPLDNTAKSMQEINRELDIQIERMIEKHEGLWKCKVCQKTAKLIGNIKIHAETHIERMSHTCHICSRTFPNRHGVRMHISNIHTQPISCEVCGKTGMNRNTYRKHKCLNN